MMLLAQGQAAGCLRAERAGAGLCLDKPLDADALRRVLVDQPALPRSEAQTTRATSTRF